MDFIFHAIFGASRSFMRLLLPVGMLLLCLLLMACQSPPASPQARRFDIKGKVVSVEKAQHLVTLDHEEIRGFMDAMVMPFKIKDDWPFDVLAPGDQVGATLVVEGDSFWLEDVVITKGEGKDSAANNSRSQVEPEPSQEVPDFSLVNQDGKHIRLHQYRGQALLLTFIYTRCPLPEYCTLMSNNFAAIQRELQKIPSLNAQTHLLSISFDPAYDTPKVLRSYGAAHTGNYDQETFAQWEFASGSEQEVKDIAQFFGLSYFPASDQIEHSLRTAIITPEGKLYKIYRGNDWKPDEVLRDLHKLFNDSQQSGVTR